MSTLLQRISILIVLIPMVFIFDSYAFSAEYSGNTSYDLLKTQLLDKDEGSLLPVLENLRDGSKEDITNLFSALYDQNGIVRKNAILLLLAIRPSDASYISLIIDLLHSQYGDSRLWAVGALVEIGEDAVQPLLVALIADDTELSYGAHVTLLEMGESAAPGIAFLIAQFSLNDDEIVKARSAEILGSIGEPAIKAVPYLENALSDPHLSVRVAALKALGKIGKVSEVAGSKIYELFREGDEEIRLPAALVLARTEKWADLGFRTLAEAAVGDDIQKAWLAIDYLTYLGPEPEVLTILAKLLQSGHYRLMIKNSDAILSFGDAASPIEAVLVDVLDDLDVYTKINIIAALVTINPEVYNIQGLIDIFNDNETDIYQRETILIVMRELGHYAIDALPFLKDLANNNWETLLHRNDYYPIRFLARLAACTIENELCEDNGLSSIFCVFSNQE